VAYKSQQSPNLALEGWKKAQRFASSLTRQVKQKVASKSRKVFNLAAGGFKKAQRSASTLARKLKQKTRGKRQVYANAAALAIAGQAYQLEEQSRGHQYLQLLQQAVEQAPAGGWRCTTGCSYRG